MGQLNEMGKKFLWSVSSLSKEHKHLWADNMFLFKHNIEANNILSDMTSQIRVQENIPIYGRVTWLWFCRRSIFHG